VSKKYDKHAELAKDGTLPADFNQWGLADKYGWTIAHVAAAHGHLPEDFKQWGLTNKNGRTVAHSAARHGHLPSDFSRWGIADDSGWTVAHEAAEHGHLPASFSQWGLLDSKGLSVLGQLLIGTQSNKFVSRWRDERPPCKTEADLAVFKTWLPEIYNKYAVVESFDDVNAAQETNWL
jgi:hypothetical protein